MGISGSTLTASTANPSGTSCPTASYTQHANCLALLLVVSAATTVVTPTVSGWVQVGSAVNPNANTRICLFRRLVTTDTTGATTISFSSSQDVATWSVVEFSGVDVSGSNGSGAVVQSAPNTGSGVSSLTATLAAFASAGNGCYGGFASNTQQAFSVGSGFTLLHAQQSGAGAAASVGTEWKATNDTTVDMSKPDTSGVIGGIAVEIKAAASIVATSRTARNALLRR